MPQAPPPLPIGAAEAAAALRAGDPGPAASLLQAWRFASVPGWCDGVLEALVETPPVAPPAVAGDPLAWGLAALAEAGLDLQERERDAWQVVDHPVDPLRDAVAQGLWQGWIEGRHWADHDDWLRLVKPIVTRTLIAALVERGLPERRCVEAARELRESLFLRLVGRDLLRHPQQRAQAEHLDGFLELAVRVLETAPPGPVDALAARMDDEGWRWLTDCPRAQAAFGPTLASLYPQLPDVHAHARAARQDLRREPRRLEALLDLLVAARLIRGWASEDGIDGRAVVANNRGKSRGRLRAVLAQVHPEAVGEALLGLDALYARTAAALRRYTWAWAQQVVRMGLAIDPLTGVTPPCEPPPPGPAPFTAPERDALRTWVLLVVLRGRLERLEEWSRTGGTQRDAVWGRLLTDALPADLKDPPAPGERQARYTRARTELALSLDALLASLRPTLAQVAALESGRDLRQRCEAVLDEVWSDAIERPTRGFPAFVRHAGEALAEGRTP
ncbi:MAG: hypothetical protein H6739_08430 [Alphaproteobacteria bacterium]|nr:hypothetical protein [Alphaproteobacteria bacterium]